MKTLTFCSLPIISLYPIQFNYPFPVQVAFKLHTMLGSSATLVLLLDDGMIHLRNEPKLGESYSVSWKVD